MKQEITGAGHKIIKKLTGLKEKKYRERCGEFLAEGELSVLWALRSSFRVTALVQSRDYRLPAAFLPYEAALPVYSLPPALFARVADTKTPQGILCVCALPEAPPWPEAGLLLYCDRVRDPGNLGSMLRSADALGFQGVLLSPQCVDPFSPKVVRSTMGSLFHIPLWREVEVSALADLQKKGFHLAASALTEASLPLREFRPSGSVIVAVGNEAAGVSEALLRQADSVVKIPMKGGAESLNAAAAAAILLYVTAGAGGGNA